MMAVYVSAVLHRVVFEALLDGATRLKASANSLFAAGPGLTPP
jgi:hypothetical protein